MYAPLGVKIWLQGLLFGASDEPVQVMSPHFSCNRISELSLEEYLTFKVAPPDTLGSQWLQPGAIVPEGKGAVAKSCVRQLFWPFHILAVFRLALLRMSLITSK